MNGLLILVGIIILVCVIAGLVRGFIKNSGFISCNNHYYRLGGFSYAICE